MATRISENAPFEDWLETPEWDETPRQAEPMSPAAAPVIPLAAGRMLRIVDHPDRIRAEWEGLEKSGLATVYQRRPFVGAWLETIGRAEKVRPALLVLADAGETILILPLVIERRFGVRIARFPGGSHSNHNMPLFAPARFAALPPEEAAGLLVQMLDVASRRFGIDIYVFDRQPVTWNKVPNPMVAAIGGRVSPTIAQNVCLAEGFDALLARHHGAAKRKKVRAKERILSAAGDYGIQWASSGAECHALLDVFLAQKSQQLAAKGIHDVFGDAATRAFFHRVIDMSSCGEPVLELAGLSAGGAVRAVRGYGRQRERISLMFQSYSDDELTRGSPGETLLFRSIEQFCGRGVLHIDFGVGRERYKDSWADTEFPLVDSVRPMTLPGRLFAIGVCMRRTAERRIRNSPRLFAAFKALRRLVGGRHAAVTAPAGDGDEQ
jgi:CelD/BcsL family acetyltransferase involved in cellulose biosynthesis